MNTISSLTVNSSQKKFSIPRFPCWVTCCGTPGAIWEWMDRTAGVGYHQSRNVYSVPLFFKELPPEWISCCFHEADSQHYVLLPHLRENIGWYLHDLLDPPPSGPFHIILLRNSLLTYYQQPALGPAVERIVETLAPGGLFIIDAHENLPDLPLPLLRDPSCPLIFHRLLS